MTARRVEGGQAPCVGPFTHGALRRSEESGCLAEGEPLSTIVHHPTCPGGLTLSVVWHWPQPKNLPKSSVFFTWPGDQSVPAGQASSDVVTVTVRSRGSIVSGSSVRTTVCVPPGLGASSSARPTARPAMKTAAITARRRIQATIRRPDRPRRRAPGLRDRRGTPAVTGGSRLPRGRSGRTRRPGRAQHL